MFEFLKETSQYFSLIFFTTQIKILSLFYKIYLIRFEKIKSIVKKMFKYKQTK